ncbi:MAG TPA: hypothetical protein PLX68_03235 [Dermatophilaceae bacterium]|nr:hypothetical protein [Dermatophilaceae bacterium]
MVNATSISVVDVNRRLIPVEIELPSNDAGDGFVLRVQFSCKVTDPSEVVAQSLSDVGQVLQAQLQSFPVVTQLAVDYAPDQIDQVRRVALATIESVKAVSPLSAPGMEVRLTGCEVLASGDVREHAKAVTGALREHDLVSLRTQHEEEIALVRVQERKRVIDEVVRQRAAVRAQGPLAEEDALFATRAAETSPAAAADRQLEERHRANDRELDWERDDREHARRIEQRDFEYRVMSKSREYDRQTHLVEALAKAGVLRELSPRAFNDLLGVLGIDPVMGKPPQLESAVAELEGSRAEHEDENASDEDGLPDPEAWGR